MTIIRSYSNGFEVVDRTQDLLLIPNQWGLINSLGVFGAGEGVATTTVTIEEQDQSLGLISDQVRGTRANANQDYNRKIHAIPVPHYPLDDYITPEDIQGKRAYGSDGPEALTMVRARKLERIRRSHAATLEYARAVALTTGTVYAPNGTVAINYYTEFGFTQQSFTWTFSSSTFDLIGEGEQIIAYIQDNLQAGEIVSEIVGLCATEWFAALISHPKVSTAYQYFASTQLPLRNRLVGPQQNIREFVFGGIRYIEYRAKFNGQRLIPASTAVFFPTDTADAFATYYAPANKFDLVNTIGVEAYVFEFADMKGSKIDIETESNFLNVLRRPQAVVVATMA